MMSLPHRTSSAMLGLLLLAGCSSAPSLDTASAGSTLRNLFLYGGTTVPPAAQKPPEDDVECPIVDVIEGGSSLRAYIGQTLRHQLSIVQTARECSAGVNGGTRLRVGVEGRILLGPGGASGRFDAPMRVRVKQGDKVVFDRTQRVMAEVPGGASQGSFVTIEDNINVPAGDFEIEVGLGSGSGKATGGRKNR
jgi:hypothetical protein